MQTTFRRFEGNPIIPHTAVPGDWKEWQVEEAFVFEAPHEAERLIMFYSGFTHPTGAAFIGVAHADLADPFRWTDSPENPILSPGGSAFNDVYIRLDAALYLDGEYWLYCTGMSRNGVAGQVGASCNSIQLARSTDGLHFEWHDEPMLLPDNDEKDVSQGAVLKDGDNWYMYYSYRTQTRTLPGIRVAISTDGLHWEKTGQEILSVEPERYDARYYEFHQALKLGADYVLLSECYDGANWSVGAAHSTSPTTGWTKSDRPLLERSGVQGAFDIHHIATPTLFDIGSRVMLFYQGGNNAQDYIMSNWDIGVAYSEELPEA